MTMTMTTSTTMMKMMRTLTIMKVKRLRRGFAKRLVQDLHQSFDDVTACRPSQAWVKWPMGTQLKLNCLSLYALSHPEFHGLKIHSIQAQHEKKQYNSTSTVHTMRLQKFENVSVLPDCWPAPTNVEGTFHSLHLHHEHQKGTCTCECVPSQKCLDTCLKAVHATVSPTATGYMHIQKEIHCTYKNI